MFTLYHHGSSVCAAKVRLALAEKKLPWTGVYLDILKGDQFAPDYLALNPKAVVPTLVHDDKVIPESTVIVEYLDLIHPENPLHPRDPYLYTKARMWTKAVDEELHPACAALTFVCSHRHTVARLGKAGTEQFLASTPEISVNSEWKEKKRRFVEMGFDAPGAAEPIRLYHGYLQKMEAALEQSDWLVGDCYSVADLSLTPYVNRLAMLSMSGIWEGGRMPRVTDWFDRIRARPAFQENLLSWVPADLTYDLATFGAKSWPDVARILDIAA